VGPFQTAAGTVTAFDEHGGYGTVSDAAGTEWTFHCTAIADDTRSIEVGAVVEFDVVPGRMGHWEATNLRPR
jgi:cold shock CspA family protein